MADQHSEHIRVNRGDSTLEFEYINNTDFVNGDIPDAVAPPPRPQGVRFGQVPVSKQQQMLAFNTEKGDLKRPLSPTAEEEEEENNKECCGLACIGCLLFCCEGL